MNNVILIGRMVRDPELRYVGDEKAVAKFCLAVDRFGKDAGADFINCEVWGKAAENTQTFCHKGTLVGVMGSLKIDKVEKEGEKSSYTKVSVREIQFLSKKSNLEDEKDDKVPF